LASVLICATCFEADFCPAVGSCTCLRIGLGRLLLDQIVYLQHTMHLHAISWNGSAVIC